MSSSAEALDPEFRRNDLPQRPKLGRPKEEFTEEELSKNVLKPWSHDCFGHSHREKMKARGIPHLPERQLFWIWKRVPMTGVECVIKKGNKILMTKRKRPPWKGWWHIPGSLLAYGETLEHAVKRVAKEDTGLNVRIRKFLGYYDKPNLDPRGQVIAHIYLCDVVSGKLRPGKNEADIRFFDKMPALPPHHRALLKKYGLL